MLYKQPIYKSHEKTIEYFLFSVLPIGFSILSMLFNDFKNDNQTCNTVVSCIILFGSMLSFAAKSNILVIVINFISILKFLVNIIWDDTYFEVLSLGNFFCKKQLIQNISPIVLILLSDILIACFSNRNMALFLKSLSSIILLIYFFFKKDFLYDIKYIFPLLTIPALLFFFFLRDHPFKRLEIALSLITLSAIITLVILGFLNENKFFRIGKNIINAKNGITNKMGQWAINLSCYWPFNKLGNLASYLWEKLPA